jgi:hypothetical protein
MSERHRTYTLSRAARDFNIPEQTLRNAIADGAIKMRRRVIWSVEEQTLAAFAARYRTRGRHRICAACFEQSLTERPCDCKRACTCHAPCPSCGGRESFPCGGGMEKEPTKR